MDHQDHHIPARAPLGLSLYSAPQDGADFCLALWLQVRHERLESHGSGGLGESDQGMASWPLTIPGMACQAAISKTGRFQPGVKMRSQRLKA